MVLFKNMYLLIFVIFSSTIIAQGNKIYGVVNSEEPLSNVLVKINELDKVTYTNNEGVYTFFGLKSGKYTLNFSFVGFKSRTEIVELNDSDNLEFNVNLEKRLIQMGEIYVTASRSEQIVKEVSLPLEYISKSEIENSTNITISDLLNRQSGLSVVRDGPWATTVNIRGLGKQNLVYVIDGTRIETSTNLAAGLSLMDPNNIESIEVVKSGLSSLYGTGATGGVINIKTKSAYFNDSIYISSQLINSYNSVNNGLYNYLNLKTGGSNWNAVLNGSLRKAEDIQTPAGKLENSQFRDESINTVLNFTPINNIFVNMNYQKFSGYDIGIPGGDPFPKNASAKYKFAKRQLIDGSIEYRNISKT